VTASKETWPALPFSEWKDTAKTLQMWTQIVGKIRLALTPWINHSWHVTLYLTARGLTTSPMYVGTRVLQIDFDFIDHLLRFQTGGTAAVPSQKLVGRDSARPSSENRTIALAPKSVAKFYGEVMDVL